MSAIIQTRRLKLTPYQIEDIPGLAEIMGDAKVMRHIGKGPLTLEEVSATVARAIQHWADTGTGWWSIKSLESGDLVGQICLKPATQLKDFEVGYAVRPTAWGTGVAEEALAAVLGHGIHALGIKRIIATVRPENVHSIALLQRCSFAFEAAIWLREKTLHLYAFDNASYRSISNPT